MYSVVLPIYNEQSCIKELLTQVCLAMDSLREPYEIICVDDGSQDRSWSILEELNGARPQIKGLKLCRNFGHQLAIYAGIKHASGNYVGVMDSDGQDPPEVLVEMFKKCREGFDVVYAIRRKRKENILKRTAYKIFYRYYKFVVPFAVPLDAGDFSVFSRAVADFIQSLNEKQPFIRGLRSWRGGKQFGLEYERQRRSAGYAKYSFYKLLQLAINATISFSKMPLRVISCFGITISGLSFLFAIFTILRKISVGINPQGWTSISVLVTFLGGLNLFVLGIIGEYIGQIFDEVKNRPAYVVEKTLGIRR